MQVAYYFRIIIKFYFVLFVQFFCVSFSVKYLSPGYCIRRQRQKKDINKNLVESRNFKNFFASRNFNRFSSTFSSLAKFVFVLSQETTLSDLLFLYYFRILRLKILNGPYIFLRWFLVWANLRLVFLSKCFGKKKHRKRKKISTSLSLWTKNNCCGYSEFSTLFHMCCVEI